MSILSAYLKASGKTQAALAAEVGVSQAYIAKLCRSGVPSLQVAVDLERVTGGAVPARSWVMQGAAE